MKTPNLIPPVSTLTKVYINPKNNDKIESVLTVGQAKEIIKNNAPAHDSFALDLASKTNLSAGQIYWLILKGEKYNPNNKEKNKKEGIKVGAGFGRIHAMFQKAKESGLKRPKIRLKDSISNLIEISLAPDNGRNAGFIYIKSNKEYAGKISPDGEFIPVLSCQEATKEYIKSFASDPFAVAKEYGRLTGQCSFCARTLTKQESIDANMGPICRARFGL